MKARDSMPRRSPVCHPLLPATVAVVAALLLGVMGQPAAAGEPPVKVLYVTGGGWHDYKGQVPVVRKAIEAALPGVEVTVAMVERVQDRHPVFEDDRWCEGYDLVVYNKCNAPQYSDPEWIERIVRPHREGVPAVIIHGTLHNYWPDEKVSGAWVAFTGITSRNHERGAPVTVTFTARDHPILDGLPETWSYKAGELYRVHGMSDDAACLATGVSGDGVEHCVVWTHRYGKGRVFGTSIGHATETMRSDEFQRLLRQGIRWALGRHVKEKKAERHLVLIAGRPSHGSGQHEHEAGMRLFAACLAGVDGLRVSVVTGGWTDDATVLETADAMAFYSDGLGGHPALQGDRLQRLDAWVKGGMGIGMIHFAVDVPPERAGENFKRWIGGHYETGYSVNPFWTATVASFPEHPITRGVKPFSWRDEWYFNMRFRGDMEGVTPILVATPSDATRDGPYVHPRGPYPHIQEAKGRAEVLMWAVERPDGGRGFGFTGGHFHEGWLNDDMRKVVLNALVWVAGVDVPDGGVASDVSGDR